MTLEELTEALRRIHSVIVEQVVAACESGKNLTDVAHDGSGDTIYEIDRVSEEALIELVTREIAVHDPVELVAEGIEPDGRVVLPQGTDPEAVRWRLLVDPIDGTRGLMYQKRSAWILSAALAANGRGLRDSVVSVMSEIPLVKQHCWDQLSAIRGQGVVATRHNRLAGSVAPLEIAPSTADTLIHGFAQIVRFFPGRRDVLAAIDDEVMTAVCGEPAAGKALCFEDQYLCTGGQFYELMMGHDRFIADLRPVVGLDELCCHPYDCAALLIAKEAGIVITDLSGAPLDAPLDIHANVAWVGYANDRLRALVEPALHRALERRGLRQERGV